MKCVICGGEDILEKDVEEEIQSGNDIIFCAVKVPVCTQCGERYYTRATMKYLEDMESNLSQKKLVEVGKVKKVLFFLFIFLLLFPCFSFCETAPKAPDFMLSSTSGEKLTLSKLKGKVVLLNFFAEWCVPCIEEIPVLNKWQKKYAPDLVVLGIDYDNTTKEKVAALKKEMGITFTCLIDSGKTVQKDYKVFEGLPLSFLIDGDGLLVERITGALSGKHAKEKEEKIKQLIKRAQEKKKFLFVSVMPFVNLTQKAKQNQLAEKLAAALTDFLKLQTDIKLSSDSPAVRIEGSVSMFSDEAGVGLKIIDAYTGDVLSTVSKPVSDGNFSPLFSALLEQLKTIPH